MTEQEWRRIGNYLTDEFQSGRSFTVAEQTTKQVLLALCRVANRMANAAKRDAENK